MTSQERAQLRAFIVDTLQPRYGLLAMAFTIGALLGVLLN